MEMGLGTTEKMVVNSTTKCINDCKTSLTKLLEEFEKIDTDAFERLILDSKMKEHFATFAPMLKQLSDNLKSAELIVIFAALILKEKE